MLQKRRRGEQHDVGRVPKSAEGVWGASWGRLGSSGTAFWRANGKKVYVVLMKVDLKVVMCGAPVLLQTSIEEASSQSCL